MVEGDQEKMPCAHRVGDQRMCGATTVSAGLNTNVFVNGVLAAVAGDLNDHGLLGALISQSPGTIRINGIPMIASIMDQGSPDVIGLITHVTGLPTPGTGSPNVNMYTGNFAGGLGMFGLSGVPAIGELMSFAGNIVGQVSRTAVQSGQSGMLAMSNMNPSVTQPTANSTIVSANTGKTFTFSSYYNNNGVVTGVAGLQVIPGSTELTTPGTYSFTVPNYNTLTVTAKGGGGGGGSGTYWASVQRQAFQQNTTLESYLSSFSGNLNNTFFNNFIGSEGGLSSFNNSLIAYGGKRGYCSLGNNGVNQPIDSLYFSSVDKTVTYNNGIILENGSSIDVGGTGGTVTVGGGGNYGIGGSAPSPYNVSLATGASSPAPGGGSIPTYNRYYVGNEYSGLRGGKGGAVTNTWTVGGSGAPTAGQVVTVVVGAGGAGGPTNQYNWQTITNGMPSNPIGYGGTNGSSGSVSISWT